ncbi:MAG: hypothetical protein ABSC25_13450 [Roseiarcus sp.]|jgi:hypothetical protein
MKTRDIWALLSCPGAEATRRPRRQVSRQVFANFPGFSPNFVKFFQRFFRPFCVISTTYGEEKRKTLLLQTFGAGRRASRDGDDASTAELKG